MKQAIQVHLHKMIRGSRKHQWRRLTHKILMSGVEMDDFDDSPYSMMFLNNEIQNEETTADQRSGNIFLNSTSHEHILNQVKDDNNQNWILIENKSKVHVRCNPNILNNIRRTDLTMHIFCNAWVNTVDMVGDMPGVQEVWENSEEIANILAMALIKK